MQKMIKWFFIVWFLVLSVLYGFAIWEPAGTLVAILYLLLAYVTYNMKIEVTKGKK